MFFALHFAPLAALGPVVDRDTMGYPVEELGQKFAHSFFLASRKIAEQFLAL